MNDEKKPLSDSEIQKLRDEIAETDRRKWLYQLIRTGAAWIAGVVITAAAALKSIQEIVGWGTGK